MLTLSILESHTLVVSVIRITHAVITYNVGYVRTVVYRRQLSLRTINNKGH